MSRLPTPTVRELLERAREDRMFSAASWAVGDAEGLLEMGSLGTYAWGDEEITEEARYDLASVTKPFMGVLTMIMAEQGLLALDDTLSQFLPAFSSSDKGDLTLRELLTHTSGMPGRVPMYRNNLDRDAMIIALRELPLRNPPGTQIEYSSQGLMLVGMILESAGGQDLDRLVQDLITVPLQMGATGFNPAPELTPLVVATEECPWRGRLVRGGVHDENAVVLGGVAGHAGLFSTVGDLARLGGALLRTQHDETLMSSAALAVMTRQGRGEPPVVRPLGFWGNDLVGSSSGDLLSASSYGHTGFTGTSLWIDPDSSRFYVLLTNRVHPSRDRPGFPSLRRRFHNRAATQFR